MSGSIPGRRRRGPPAARCGLAAAVALLVLAPGVPPAGAHATLMTSSPIDGSVLRAEPARVDLTFNEPVTALALTLREADGTLRRLAPIAADDGRIVGMTLPPAADVGTRVLGWRVASADGHPVAGTLLFSVGAPTPVDTSAPDPTRPGVRAALWAARLLVHIALFFGVGAVFHALVTARRPARMPVVLVAGLLALPAVIGLHGLDALGGDVPLLATTHPWATAAATTILRAGLFAAAALCLAALAVRLPRRAGVAAILLALLCVGATLAASGHAASAAPAFLTRPALVLHGVCLAIWLGALPPLAASLRSGDGDDDALRRFSVFAPALVGALALTGLFLAAVQVPAPGDLVATDYGRVLLVKLALAALLCALAALNRWRFTLPARAGVVPARRALRHAIRGEVAIGLAILAVVGAFRFTPPPRALAAAAAAPAAIHIHTPAAMADLTLDPGHSGPITATAFLMTGDFGPLQPRAVRLVLDPPDGGPPVSAALRPGAGSWTAEGIVLPVPGRWTAHLGLDFGAPDPTVLSGAIDIRR